MVQLSFLEEVKDKASRLIPTAYMEIVEEATAPQLSIPIYEHVMFLCDSANSKPDAIGDIVRALRRRITDDNPNVKHLLVLLLDAMVKNCGSNFHAELCSQKGILRDLVKLAAEPPASARGMQAKEAALTLTLNLSVWFAGHPDPACHLLTTLSSDVRAISGPNAYEGIRPDTRTRIRMTAAPQAANAGRQHKQRTAEGAHRQHKEKKNYVDAIPINLPTETTLAGMLDSCVTFSEYLNNATVTPDGSIVHDDVVTGFATKIEEDHDYVTILLSSNLQVDRDVLRSIGDSQSSVLHRLNTKQAPPGQGRESNAPALQTQTSQTTSASPALTTDAPAASDSAPQQRDATPLRTAVPPASAEGNQSATTQSQALPDLDDIFGNAVDQPPPPSESAAPAAAPATAPPAMEDIFGAPQPASAAASVTPAPTQENTAVDVPNEPVPAVAPALAPDVPLPEEKEEEGLPPPRVPAEAPAVDLTSDCMEAAAAAAAAVAAASAEPQAPVTEATPPAATATAAADDDDDFDAFLEGKLHK